ncbi:MAG: hypothetical protein WBD38_00450 [Candidatus Dormiibacterota bacterium]
MALAAAACLLVAACDVGSPPPQVSPSVAVPTPATPEVRIATPTPARPPQSPPAGAPAPD